MKHLYFYKKSQSSSNCEKNNTIANVKIFKPRMWKLLLDGESWSIKKIAVRILFQTITKGKARVFYVSDANGLKHTSYVVPKCKKFLFLGDYDYEIGPCYTYPKHRGKGIYPDVLRIICSSLGNDETTFYMIVDDSNIASVKGIEKAGFIKCGVVKTTKYTKRYHLV